MSIRPTPFPRRLLLAPLLAFASVTAAEAGPDYIGFRYDNSGVFPDAKPPTDFDGPSKKNLLWSMPLSNFGNASPVVVAGPDGKARVLTLVDHGWPLGEGDTPVLFCHDADSGAELWKRAIDPLDAMPAEKADPLRASRHAYWMHQHQAGRLHHKYHYEATTDEQREAIKAEAAEHVPDQGHNKPVTKFFGKPSGNARMGWTAAFNHPDCQAVAKAGILGYSSWNWTGMGMAMCTPVSDGEAIYVVTGLRTVTKLTLDGEVLWHVFQEDAQNTTFFECWLANGLHLLPVEIDGTVRKLLVYELYDHLWAIDCASGKVVWKTPTSNIGGHVCGTPQLLRLDDGGTEELLVVTRSGHIVRARDGYALGEFLFNVNYAGPLSDGRDRLWIKQVGGDGGHFHPKEGSAFDKKCAAGLRFRLEDGKLAWDKLFYDEQDYKKRPIADWLGFHRGDELLTKDLARADAATGDQLAASPRGFGSYNGTILAGGHFYAVPRMTTLEGAPKGTKAGEPGVDVRMVVCVAKDEGSSVSFVGQRTVEIIEADPQDPTERDQRMALTGRVHPGEWYCWHAAYVAPFAFKNRLYVRSFDHLYCFGSR